MEGCHRLAKNRPKRARIVATAVRVTGGDRGHGWQRGRSQNVCLVEWNVLAYSASPALEIGPKGRTGGGRRCWAVAGCELVTMAPVRRPVGGWSIAGASQSGSGARVKIFELGKCVDRIGIKLEFDGLDLTMRLI